MIITFCGHSTFCQDDKYKAELLELLERKIGNEQALFYLGEHGRFDSFAYKLAKEYKLNHPNARLIHVIRILMIDVLNMMIYGTMRLFIPKSRMCRSALLLCTETILWWSAPTLL